MRTPSSDRDAAITSWPPTRSYCGQSTGADAQGGAAASQPSTPLRPHRLCAPLSAGVSSVHVVRFGIEFLSVSGPPIFFREKEVHP